ncbi:MAG: phosphatase PAP2 family protein [Patescibacteria group bacterium]
MYEIDVAILWWANSWVFWRDWADTVIIFHAVFLGWWALAGLAAFGMLTLPPLSTVFPSFRQFRRKNWGMVFVALASAFIARYGMTELIRFFYDRPRPFEVLTDLHQLILRDGGGSFPSGHATFYFAIAAVISRYYPKTSILFFLMAFNLSVARIQAGLHWPSDVLGGAAIGIAVGLLTHWLTKKYQNRSAGE